MQYSFNQIQVENLDEHAPELLMAAEKYNLPKLKNMAEISICKNLKVPYFLLIIFQMAEIERSAVALQSV